MPRSHVVTGAAVLVRQDGGTAVFRFLSIRSQLMLETKGLKSSGGPLRPRLQPQPVFQHLKKTDPREKYIHACELYLALHNHPSFVHLREEAEDLWPADTSVQNDH